MKRLLITIFISAEHNVQQGNSIKEYGTYKECEEALITINDIDEAINGNKSELIRLSKSILDKNETELIKDKNGFTASIV